MTISNGTILKVVLDYVYPGAGTALNIFNYVYSGADLDDQVVLDGIEDWVTQDWADAWKGLSATEATLENMKVQEVTGLGLVVRDVGFALINQVGINIVGVLPAANSAYIQAYTGIPQVRGSKYVPAISEDEVANGKLTGTGLITLLLLAGFYTDRINLGTGNNLDPGVISKREGGFKQFSGATLTTDIPAYQRRRKEGVGS